MKKIYFLAFALSAFCLTTTYGQIDQQDNIDSYDLGNISYQSPNWKTWSGDEGGPEDGIVSTNQASSGSQSLMIDAVGAPDGKDQLYIIQSQPSSGLYTVKFKLYVPTGKEAYFNLQGTTPPDDQGSGSFLGPDIYFNPNNTTPGQGQVGDASFIWPFPHDTWFLVEVVLDLDDYSLKMDVDGQMAIPEGTPFNDLNVPYFGAIDFYAPSASTLFYVDDVVTGFGILGIEDLTVSNFSVFPNPVTDILTISTKTAVDNITVYDVLGKVVLTAQPDTISPRIDMSGLPTGAYMVQVTIGNNSKTVQVLK